MHAPLCPISILIPTKNERANIRACLESCRFADEVILIDSGSTDGTREIAAEFGAAVIDFKWNGSFPKKKNWALQNVQWRHEWIFILDADERIMPPLAAELHALLTGPNPPCAGYYVNRRFWFLDGWLMHCGYYPSWNVRLLRRSRCRFEEFAGIDDTRSGDNEVHEQVLIDGTAGRLRGEMEHYAFPTIDIWVEKHNRYSNWEAKLLASRADHAADTTAIKLPSLARKRRLKLLAARLPFRPLLRFAYHYVLCAGFLDGHRGYVFCRLMAIYEFLSVAKARELSRTGKS
jgi:glycosyltransferase involved in cell wall biosynthesis